MLCALIMIMSADDLGAFSVILCKWPRIQERKISPKRKFLGRTSRGHPGVIRADIPARNFGQGTQNTGKNKHLGADIHDPKVRTSTTPRDFQKLRSEKLWVEFSFPKNHRQTKCTEHASKKIRPSTRLGLYIRRTAPLKLALSKT